MSDLLAPIFATSATLKARAKRLRAGTEMSHSEGLEELAHLSGCRDWNVLSARAAPARTVQGLVAGERLAGTYLGHFFVGEIKELQSSFAGGVHRITLRFEEPVDVVVSTYFSNFRQQITLEIEDDGCTVAATSDGVPHLVLEL